MFVLLMVHPRNPNSAFCKVIFGHLSSLMASTLRRRLKTPNSTCRREQWRSQRSSRARCKTTWSTPTMCSGSSSSARRKISTMRAWSLLPRCVIRLNQRRNPLNIFPPLVPTQIYGDNENIFGYRGLKISLFMTSSSLRSYVHVEYDEKVNG